MNRGRAIFSFFLAVLLFACGDRSSKVVGVLSLDSAGRIEFLAEGQQFTMGVTNLKKIEINGDFAGKIKKSLVNKDVELINPTKDNGVIRCGVKINKNEWMLKYGEESRLLRQGRLYLLELDGVRLSVKDF